MDEQEKSEFDKFVDDLQEEIKQQEIDDFNEYIVNLFHDPKNWGKPEVQEITVEQSYQGPCGDTMQFFLKIDDGVIKKANFITDGCGASVATGSQTMQMIEGKSIDFAQNVTPDDIDKALQGLTIDHKHCAELAKRTLRRALAKYQKDNS